MMRSRYLNVAGPTSDQVFAHAQKEGRVLLPHNRSHFKRLHRQHQPNHFGIVICTTDPDFIGLAGRIHETLADLPSLRGQLIRICRPDRGTKATTT